MAFVSYAEKAFLQLVAKRLLRYTREAESRGEVYHDISPYAPLQCGAMAKFRFVSRGGLHVPVAVLKNTPNLNPGELKAIAEELLDAPATLRFTKGDDLEYGRTADTVI